MFFRVVQQHKNRVLWNICCDIYLQWNSNAVPNSIAHQTSHTSCVEYTIWCWLICTHWLGTISRSHTNWWLQFNMRWMLEEHVKCCSVFFIHSVSFLWFVFILDLFAFSCISIAHTRVKRAAHVYSIFSTTFFALVERKKERKKSLDTQIPTNRHILHILKSIVQYPVHFIDTPAMRTQKPIYNVLKWSRRTCQMHRM